MAAIRGGRAIRGQDNRKRPVCPRISKMGYGKGGGVMGKGKETKEMGRWAPFGLEVSEQRSLRADCLETVPSVPGFCPRILKELKCRLFGKRPVCPRISRLSPDFLSTEMRQGCNRG